MSDAQRAGWAEGYSEGVARDRAAGLYRDTISEPDDLSQECPGCSVPWCPNHQIWIAGTCDAPIEHIHWDGEVTYIISDGYWDDEVQRQFHYEVKGG